MHDNPTWNDKRSGHRLRRTARTVAGRLVPLAGLVFAVTVVMAAAAAPAVLAGPPLPGMLPQRQIPSQLKASAKNTKVGGWAEYAVSNRRTGQVFRWKMALVGQPTQTTQWWEHVLRWGRLKTLIIKVLVRNPSSRHAKVIKAIWKPGGHQALLLPLRKGAKLMDIYLPIPHGKATLAGKGPVTVAAGRFQTDHYIVRDRLGRKTHFWVNSKIPIFGLVKLDSPSLRLELLGSGHSAITQIHEKPGKWPFPVQ